MKILGREVGARKADLATYRAAKDELEEVGKRARKAGIRHETDEYRKANSAVLDAEKPIPWWQR